MSHSLFKHKTVYFASLGCSKNLVDSQVMLGHLKLDGYKIETAPEKGEVIVVNTCSFVGDAKKESVDTILSLLDYKDPTIGVCKAFVVAGCMAQRYARELEKEMPEVDLIIGTGEYNKIHLLLKALNEGQLQKKSFVEIPRFIHTEFDPRLNTSPSYMAWLKISEGCNRNCTFCIIPTLRGRLRSRSVESLVAETKSLVEKGVKEVNLISQDLSDYGNDLAGPNKLYDLLTALDSLEGLEWIRLFYFYPDDLTDEVMDLMARSKKICKYLDMPVQHFSDSVLRRMGRKITGKEIHDKIKRLRERVPVIVIRTSIIVGFPGETEVDFHLLLEGVKVARFNHLGVFKYSDEEGTPAHKLDGKVSAKTIQKRFEALYELQKEVSREIQGQYLNQTIDVLVEGTHEETDLLIQGRHQGQAPEIDGKVIINDSEVELKVGEFYKVEVTEVLDYDLVGRVSRR